MSGPAQVRSTDAIERLDAALARFQQRVQAALDSLDADVRRSGDWVEHDRPAHWRRQVHEAEDGVHAAKIELERCLTYSTQERPSCREQKAALETARARLDYCRAKVEEVKRWQRNFRHESFEYDGRVGQLRRVMENDVPRARAALSRILLRLEEYRVEQAPQPVRPLDATLPTPVAAPDAVPPPPSAAAPPPDS